MSAPYANIRAAFTSRLQTLTALPSVAWENVPFTPVGMPYLKPFLLPGEPFQCGIGTNGQNRHTGIYQISIFVPAGTGVATINTLIGNVCDHFKRGTILAYGGIQVTCSKAYPGPTITETDWQHVPITIMFRCDAVN